MRRIKLYLAIRSAILFSTHPIDTLRRWICRHRGHRLVWASKDPVMFRPFLLCLRCGKYARSVDEFDLDRFWYDPDTLTPHRRTWKDTRP